MPLSFLPKTISLGLLIAGGALFAQTPAKTVPAVFLVETSPAYYSDTTAPEMGFVIRNGDKNFIPKIIAYGNANPSLHVNPFGLPSGQGFNTESLQGTYSSGYCSVALYTIAPREQPQPLTVASHPPKTNDAVKIWIWDKERREPVEVAAVITSTASPPNRVRLSRRLDQRQVLGAPACNAEGEVFGIVFKQGVGGGTEDLVFIPLKPEWGGTVEDKPADKSRDIPGVWRTWIFDGKNHQPAVASTVSAAGDAVVLGLWHDNKWIQRPILLSRLSATDRAWISDMLKSGNENSSPVPLSRSATTLAITAPKPSQMPWPLSKASRRPCIEIDGVSGAVTFRARVKTDDRVFLMTDPVFQSAVKDRTLDRLINQTYVTYTKLGTLTIPVKLTDFPLLGQDNTSTCYVSHYREWLVYYLGDRALLMPCLENLRSYLNFLLNNNPSLSQVLAGSDTKNANAFDAKTRLARARSRDFLNNVSFFCRNFLIGAETMPFTKFSDIDASSQNLQFSSLTRQFSEAMFGTLLEGLLLGQMTLGESESHVMNIIGIDGDKLAISTWAREYEGTLRELAQADRRGPLLAPTVFAQFPIVARNREGRVVIPALDPVSAPGLTPVQLKAVARFNQGTGSN